MIKNEQDIKIILKYYQYTRTNQTKRDDRNRERINEKEIRKIERQRETEKSGINKERRKI